MYIIISPSKTQDFSRDFSVEDSGGKIGEANFSTSIFNNETKNLSKIMKGFSVSDLSKTMKISEKLSDLNYERFQAWNGSFLRRKKTGEEYNFSPAIFAFTGDVYRGFDLENWKKDDFLYAEKSLGIVSGFYGIMSPLTFLKPYRLEMGTRMSFSVDRKNYKNLYYFWEEKLTSKMDAILKSQEEFQEENQEKPFLLNLASKEYSKAIDFKKLEFDVLDIDFKIRKNIDGKNIDKIIAIFAKRARGDMANWAIKNRIQKKKDIKKFSEDDWFFDEKNSSHNKYVFVKIKDRK